MHETDAGQHAGRDRGEGASGEDGDRSGVGLEDVVRVLDHPRNEQAAARGQDGDEPDEGREPSKQAVGTDGCSRGGAQKKQGGGLLGIKYSHNKYGHS